MSLQVLLRKVVYSNEQPQRRVKQLSAYFRGRGNQSMKERGINGRLYGRSIVHIYLVPIDYEPSDNALASTKDVDNG